MKFLILVREPFIFFFAFNSYFYFWIATFYSLFRYLFFCWPSVLHLDQCAKLTRKKVKGLSQWYGARNQCQYIVLNVFLVFVKGYRAQELQWKRIEPEVIYDHECSSFNEISVFFVFWAATNLQTEYGIYINRFFFSFSFLLQAILVAVAVMALVSAVPVDETVVGEVYGQSDSISPQDQSEIFFKLKKLKKLLFG